MRLGVMANCFSDKSWKDACKAAKEAGLKAIEPCCGGFLGKVHCNPEELLKDRDAIKKFAEAASMNGLEISAFSVHGNPLHPDNKIADEHRADLEAAIKLAQMIGVKVINTFAGCPGAGPDAKYPNWITSPWPTYFGDGMKWQWEKRALPFWKEMPKKAKKAGVKFGFEMHPGDLIYNTETFLKLREHVGAEEISCNFDPSHLFWQGMDPIICIKILGDAIIHVHAKDIKIDKSVVEFSGVFGGINDWEHIGDIANKAYTFRTVGNGHGTEFWNDFVYALRLIDYDGVISIENEDPFMPGNEGLKKAIDFLNKILLFKEVRDKE